MKDKLLKRVMDDKCPICNETLAGEVVIVPYNEAKLKVHKRHIKYKTKE